MGLISWIKGVIGRMFKNEATKTFDTAIIQSDSMDRALSKWISIYKGNPPWVDEEDFIKTINFAKTVSSETARLVTLDLDVNISGSGRADYLQKQVNTMYEHIRKYVEKACAYGMVVFKPNGVGVDCITPDNFLITAVESEDITGIIFFDYYNTGDKYYTRMEWHRYEEGNYLISNRAYVSDSEGVLGKPINLDLTPTWSGMLPDVQISKSNGEALEKPLFSVFKMPTANNIDLTSPLGMSIFAEAIEETKDLDIAYSRYTLEIYDSKRIVLADDRLLAAPGTKVERKGAGTSVKGLPHYVKNVYGNDAKEFYQEINPQLNTEVRIKGINQQLSLIGYKCGYSSGYFVFDEKTGMVTATQVESDDRRTIQLIKDIRDALKIAMNNLLYAMDKYADLYGLASVGIYEADYAFGDITYNWEEDRVRHWQYVQAGKFPLWRYYVKFEGYSKEEAKELVQEAQGENKEPTLFGKEE